jgi:hypothetical protein
MTHADLVERAARWLRNSRRCGVVLTELVTIAEETPDAIGWTFGGRWSYLVECKVSRSDYYADASKPGRSMLRAAGLGRERYYMAPAGVLDAEHIRANRPGWGLLEVSGRRVRVALVAVPHSHEARIKEIPLLYSCVWRIQHSTGLEAIAPPSVEAQP